MSAFDRILNEFSKLGYNANSYLQQDEVNKVMDSISSKNIGANQFDRSIAEELWTHCQPDPVRGVMLSDYIKTIMEAQNILRDQIGITEEALRMEKRAKQRGQLQDQYNQIINDHRIISSPFGLPPLRQTMNLNTSQMNQNGVLNSQRMGDTVIFSYQPNSREQSSTDLKICLFLAGFCLLWELILMFTKHHFMNLLCIFAILSIFFLNYFDKNYMKFLLIFIGITVLYDLAWLGVNATEYWNPQPQTQHSTLHSGFLVFVWIMVIVMMVLRIVMFGILFKYRDNAENYRKNVSVIGYRMKLDGKATYNPFTPLLRAAPSI